MIYLQYLKSMIFNFLGPLVRSILAPIVHNYYLANWIILRKSSFNCSFYVLLFIISWDYYAHLRIPNLSLIPPQDTEDVSKKEVSIPKENNQKEKELNLQFKSLPFRFVKLCSLLEVKLHLPYAHEGFHH
ncbi:129aa long hypothetical protein [Pyrococcus horikoshii OT3]|uniref:Uncharacterized protein n=1 Tax=Pyrococcus horikoshii (strain ATCC 700860 / DSM 12428 / JCM 9974 / NBRC 100139 / OT-3) TaxID=70601 RepID=O58220_PYRHO|nr:129aa long hypothetical protein [Pyrococcus horikoshii OT3]